MPISLSSPFIYTHIMHMCQAPIGYSPPTTLLIGPLVNPMWFISKYLSYSTLFTCCIIQIWRMQRPWQIHHSPVAYLACRTFSGRRVQCPWPLLPLARCILHSREFSGQTRVTPVSPLFACPLHCPLHNIRETDWCNACGFLVHSAVALSNTY